MRKGLVIKNTGSWYLVKTDEGEEIRCRIRGSFRLKNIKSTSPVVVGDKVSIELEEDKTAVITEIQDRKNYIIRRSPNLSKQTHILAANIDTCFLIVTLCHPTTYTVFIDRFLASAEAYRVPVHIIFNKIDIYDEDDLNYLEALTNLYEYIGYKISAISTWKGIGIDALKEEIKGKTTLLAGHSGVGKSTLINTLMPDVRLKTGTISEHHGRGMHTTTYSEMVELPAGGYIIDTPGIKGFAPIEMKKEEIYHFFKEIFESSKNCKFHNCLHLNEPGCAVIEAVSKHHISESRYNSYLNMMEEEKEEKYR